jgi:predicted ATPase/DNA-binding winged helix-turn-helix (wHTH) protein
MADGGIETGWVISFGPFRVTRARRLVERNGEAVRIGSRAFDVLVHLLEHAGQVVSHRALLEAVWPGTYVEEGNLRFQMAALRKALGDGEASYIINVPGRGYCFTAPISKQDESKHPPILLSNLVGQPAPLPRPPRLFGRDQTVENISGLVRTNKILSIVAPGGMGKTSIAAMAASQLGQAFADGVCFAELNLMDDAMRVSEALAVAIGLPVRNAHTLTDIVNFLQDRQMLIVMDGCEHAIASVAVLVERLIEQAVGVHVLVTSREALRIDNEKVFYLEPLASPPTGENLSAAEILSYPASQLFMEKTRATAGAISADREAKYIAEICSKLDGLALAIELVASQVHVYGIDKLSNLLEDGWFLTWRGRRTAPPRHQTLYAMLDWSYRLLPENEKRVFRCISVFSGQFDLEAASAVANKDVTGMEIASTLAELASKSLLSLIRTESGRRYRLLDTTRAYAREKLAEANEVHEARRRHAGFFVQALQNLKMNDLDQSLLRNFAGEIEDVRTAVMWAFSPAGDLTLALSLATGTIPLLNHANFFQEMRQSTMNRSLSQGSRSCAPKQSRFALRVVPRE